MTEIKNMDVKGVNTGAVSVSLSKLTEGVGTIFAGVLTMLEALDANTADTIARSLLREHVQDGDAAAEKEEEDAGEESTAGPDDSAADDATSAHDAEPAPADVVDQPGSQSAVPSITADDITKIIVQKIKQKRSNNEKIGAVLKTYGVSKVSELPVSKYEAFLTDLSAI